MELINPKINTKGNPFILIDTYSTDTNHGLNIATETPVEFFVGWSASMDGDAIGAVVPVDDSIWIGFVYQTRYRTFKAWSFTTEAEAKYMLSLHIRPFNHMLDRTACQFTEILPAAQIRSISDATKIFSPILFDWIRKNG